jgi:hypothetical protein
MDRMLHGRESFWTAVYPVFMARELTRSDLRLLIARGLQQTGGNYKMLAGLFNMPAGDYKRFLNFLRRHGCDVPYQRYRAARRSSAESPPSEANDDPRRGARRYCAAG